MSEQKKILLLEDRPGRQSQFLSKEQQKTLEQINNLHSPIGSECVTVIDEIKKQKANLEQYDLIIVHKSSLNIEGLMYLKNLKKDLILFSGGLSQTVYQNDGFPILSINSAELYNNLISFLKKYSTGNIQSLTELVYGEKWKLSVLLQYRMLKTILKHSQDEGEKTELEEKMNSIKKSIKNFPDNLSKEINKQILLV